MTSHPSIPVQQLLLRNNPLVNPFRQISDRNRTMQDVFNDRLQLREEGRMKKEEEISRRIQEYKDNERQQSEKNLGDIDYNI